MNIHDAITHLDRLADDTGQTGEAISTLIAHYHRAKLDEAEQWNTRIPTPADCEKWEALREAARGAYLSRYYERRCDVEAPLEALGDALAALDAPKEEGA